MSRFLVTIGLLLRGEGLRKDELVSGKECSFGVELLTAITVEHGFNLLEVLLDIFVCLIWEISESAVRVDEREYLSPGF